MHNISSGYQVSGSGVGFFRLEKEVLVVVVGGDGDDVGGSVMAPDGGKGAYSRATASESRSRLDSLLSPVGNVWGLAAMLSGTQEDLPSVISRDVERLLAEAAKAAFDSTDMRATRRGEKAGVDRRRRQAGRSSTSCVQVSHRTGGVGGAIEQARTRRGIVVVDITGGGIANKSILERIDKAELLVRGRTC
jgi:hypothetical protein